MSLKKHTGENHTHNVLCFTKPIVQVCQDKAMHKNVYKTVL